MSGERIGLSFYGGLKPVDIIDCAREAETSNYESLWMPEGLGGDAFSILSACAAVTKKAKLATGITSVFSRTPTIIAMAAATLDWLSSGRFVLGLGSSHKVQVQGDHGIPYSKPLQRIKETHDIIRELLQGKAVTYNGEIYSIRGAKFWFPTLHSTVPIYIGAVGENTLRYTGSVADGVLLTLVTKNNIADSIALVKEGATAAGRDDGTIDVAGYLYCAISDDRSLALKTMKNRLAWRIGYFPRYANVISRSGFAGEAEKVREAWKEHSVEDVAKEISDALVDEFTLVGSPEYCAKKVQEYRAKGLKLPIVYPYPVDLDEKSTVLQCISAFK